MKRTMVVLAVLGVMVAAVGVGRGQAGGGTGTPITACDQTVTQNAYLTRDLTCPGTEGVVVGAAGITVDLKGHTLRGDRSGGHIGVDDRGRFDRLTIKNGTVSKFDWGVVGNANSVSVSDLVVSGSIGDGVTIFGDSASISSVTAVGNHNSGVSIYGASGKVQSSTASGNGYAGFYLVGDLEKVLSSTASGNSMGVMVYGNSATIQWSTASGNDTDGIQVDGDAPQIKSNHADGNGFLAPDGSGTGILATNYTTAPVGANDAHGNDDPADCAPSSLC